MKTKASRESRSIYSIYLILKGILIVFLTNFREKVLRVGEERSF